MNYRPLFRFLGFLVESQDLRMLDYVLAENRIYRSLLPKKPRLNPRQKSALASLAKGIPRKLLRELSTFATPETLFRWHRDRVCQKWDTSKQRGPGRPGVKQEIKELTIQFAQENPTWGYSKILGALRNLGFKVCRQTIANILKKHGITPAPERQRHTTWSEFIRRHMDCLVGTDLFTVEVWEGFSLVTYYVLFFVHLGTRRVHLGGITRHPDGHWMKQVARNLTMEKLGFLKKGWWVIHDRGGQFCPAFLDVLRSAGVHALRLPCRSPNMNAFAERWVRSVKEECLSKMILVGEPMLRNALKEYLEHYHKERNHQGVGNLLLFPEKGLARGSPRGEIERKQRLGGLLNYYRRSA